MNLSECEKIHKMLVWVEDCETEKQTIEVWKKLVSFVPFASMQFKCQYLKISIISRRANTLNFLLFVKKGKDLYQQYQSETLLESFSRHAFHFDPAAMPTHRVYKLSDRFVPELTTALTCSRVGPRCSLISDNFLSCSAFLTPSTCSCRN